MNKKISIVVTMFGLFGCASNKEFADRDETFHELRSLRDSQEELQRNIDATLSENNALRNQVGELQEELADTRQTLQATQDSLEQLRKQQMQVPGEPVQLIVIVDQELLPEDRSQDNLPFVTVTGKPNNSEEVRVFTDTVSSTGTGFLYVNPGVYELEVRTFSPARTYSRTIDIDASPGFRETVYLSDDCDSLTIKPMLKLGPEAKAAGVEGVLIERESLGVVCGDGAWDVQGGQMLWPTMITEKSLQLAQTFIIEGRREFTPMAPSSSGLFEQITGEYEYRLRPVRVAKSDAIPGREDALVTVEGVELSLELKNEGDAVLFSEESAVGPMSLTISHDASEKLTLILEMP